MTITVTATVRQDGALELSAEELSRLGLQVGEQVALTVEVEPRPEPGEIPNPLYGIIGLGKAGHSDGAENHDRYLYGRQ